jgi:His-Xaa-Ser system protein HxsD
MTIDDAVPLSMDSQWDKLTVPLEAIERALYSLADRATGSIREETRDWVVTLVPRSAKIDLASLGHALRQEINDQTLRVKIASRTDSVRSLIFALAFSRSGLIESPAQE